MSRSFKKNLGFQNPSMGDWKRDVNRSFRRISHHMLDRIADGDEDAIDELPGDVSEIADIWDSPNDGHPAYISPKELEGDSFWTKPHRIKGK